MAQPTNELRIAIQALHAAIAAERDPGDTQKLSQCLQIMTGVQARLMQPPGAGPQQQAQAQPQVPQGAPPALLAQLLAGAH